MSFIMLADPTPWDVREKLERLGYKLTNDAGSIPLTQTLGLGFADYLVVVGRAISLRSAMLIGAAIAGGVRIIMIDPVPDALELVSAPACAFVCPTWAEALTGFFSHMKNANWEKGV